ncbi:MAG: flagellar basal body-associated FliL family protein [Pseudomonas sp.]
MPAAADKITKKPSAKDPSQRGKSVLLITAIVLIVAAAAGGGAWFFLNDGEDAKPGRSPPSSAIPAPAQYFAMDPPFVVNLNGPIDGPRYLQVEVQLVSRDPEEAKLINGNAPAIRARLLMLLSGVQATEIADLAGRQKLQQRALAEAQKVMLAETGSKCIEDLLFTSFVTQ